MRVQALRTRPCVQRIDVRAVSLISGVAEGEPHILANGPRAPSARRKLRPVVDLDHQRAPISRGWSVEHVDHGMRGKGSHGHRPVEPRACTGWTRSAQDASGRPEAGRPCGSCPNARFGASVRPMGRGSQLTSCGAGDFETDPASSDDVLALYACG